MIPEKFKEIQSEIEHQYCYISKENVKELQERSNGGTIDPNNDIRWQGEQDKDEMIKTYLFGPICPKDFFKQSFRIVWLLKEPYLTPDSWEKGDRGGHNQAEERNKQPLGDDVDAKGNPTYKKILNVTYRIITNKECEDENNEDVFNVFRKHTCIINVNNFPTFKTKSDDTRIGKWAKKK